MARYRPLTIEIAAPATASTATNLSEANVVRAVNTATATAILTVTDAAGDIIGTMTMVPNEVAFIDKAKVHKVFASAATVLITSVTYPI